MGQVVAGGEIKQRTVEPISRIERPVAIEIGNLAELALAIKQSSRRSRGQLGGIQSCAVCVKTMVRSAKYTDAIAYAEDLRVRLEVVEATLQNIETACDLMARQALRVVTERKTIV
jgi:hypothetical protein